MAILQTAVHINSDEVICRLVEENLTYYLNATYSRYTAIYPTLDRDVVMSGVHFGLLDAARRFDSSLGYKFRTFAGRRVFGAVVDMIREDDRRPRSMQERGGQDVLVPLEEIHIAFEGGRHNWQEIFGTRDPLPDDFDGLLPCGLKPNEKYVLERYYRAGISFLQIGTELGLSESRASFLHKRAIHFIRLHTAFRSEQMRMTLDEYEEALLYRRAG